MKSCRIPIYLLLAVLGFLVGERLPEFIFPSGAKQTVVVGESLALAKSSPNGKYVVGVQVKSGDWFLCAFDSKGNELIKPRSIEPSTGFVERVAWSADSKRCAVASSAEVIVCEFEGGKARTQVLPAVWQVRELRFRGERLLARCNDTVLIWDSRLRPEWRVGADSVLHADLTADGRYLAVGVFQSGVLLADLKKKKVIRDFDRGRTPAFLRFSKNDQQLLVAFRNRNDRANDFVIAYDHLTGKPVSSPIKVPILYTCEVSSDGSTLLTVGESECAIWNVANSSLRCKPEFPSGVRSALSPDGQFALSAVGGKTGTVVWDTKTGKVREKLKTKGECNWLDIASPHHLTTTSGGQATLWHYRP